MFDDFFKIDEIKLKHELYNGNMSEPMKRLSFERGDSVGMLVWNKESERLVLTEQFRFCTYEKGPGWLLEIPAGVVEAGEDPEETAQREILEETGYRAERLTHLYSFYVSPGGTTERIILYYAEVENKDRIESGGGVVLEHEDIRILELSQPEMRAKLAAGEIVDAKTLIALMWFQQDR